MSILATFVAALPTIWIVDAANGPGTNFTDLPAAVAAAQSGDTLIVRAGSYTAFAVSGKALTILGAGAAATIVDRTTPSVTHISIDNTPPGTTFAIAGVTLRPIDPSSIGDFPALRVLAGATVAAMDCTMAAPTYQGISTPASLNNNGALVFGTLHLARCTCSAGTSNTGGIGADGIRVLATGRLSTDACTCVGASVGGPAPANFGGSGVLVTGGSATIYAPACFGGSAHLTFFQQPTGAGSGVAVFGGGFARIAGSSADVCSGGATANGASGGAGVRTDLVSSARVHGPVRLLAGSFSGSATLNNVVLDVALPRLQITGALLTSGATNAALPVTVAFTSSQANQPALLLVDVRPEYTSAPILLGELLVAGNAPIRLDAVTDASGSFQFTYTPAAVIPQALGTPFFLQAGVWDGTRALLSSRELRVFSL